jgi:arginase
VIGIADTLSMTAIVREAVRETVAGGARPLLIGGCCALVPGALAGLRDAVGTVGAACVDGHVDVYDGTTSPTGEGADMPMSVAFGLGPDAWVDAAGGASVAPADAVVLGARDPDEARDIAALRAGALVDLEVLGPDDLRAAGLATAGARAAQRLAAGGGRFWIHLDVDVLDEREMPATDYLMPGGLDWDELAALLGPLGAAPGLAGFSLGCLNPEKDPDGAFTERTCALLAGALAPA